MEGAALSFMKEAMERGEFFSGGLGNLANRVCSLTPVFPAE